VDSILRSLLILLQTSLYEHFASGPNVFGKQVIHYPLFIILDLERKMDPTIKVDARVEVAAVFHSGRNAQPICLPVKMKYKNREIIFTTLGMRHPTASGRRMIHVFDMSDGVNDYRLEFDAEALTWRLMAMLEGSG